MTYPDRSCAIAWLRPVRRGVRRLALALCLWGAGLATSLAGPPPWPEAPYSYYAENTPLDKLLTEFANSFSLTLALQPGLGATVNGRFNAATPTEFISRLGGVYGFTWYTHAGMLHVSPTRDVTMRAIPVPPGTPNLRAVLTQLGVVEPRFGWAEMPTQRAVMLSGPGSYIDLVEATIRKLPGASSLQEVRLFRLRHASADDRAISFRGGSVQQPGLANVLRQLIGGRGAVLQGFPEAAESVPLGSLPASTTTADATAADNAANPARRAPAQGGGSLLGAAAGMGASPTGTLQVNADPSQRVPSIQSDPRLNAIIVQDQPERMPVYERLIAQLDVSSPLVEIEAMIIDINSDSARELGINWSFSSGSTSIDYAVGTFNLAQGASSAIGSQAGAQLLARIRALESRGEARIQSRPSVLTIDNIGAVLDLSDTFYIRVQGERVATISPVTAGTSLRVTPRAIDGPHPAIHLSIDIEDGQIQDRLVDALPTVRRSTVSTQAIVRQDEMLIIAGYTSDQNVESSVRVPLLGDLPYVGALFTDKVRAVQRRERFFMIRPKLLASPTAGEP